MTLHDQIKLLNAEVAVAWLDLQRLMTNSSGQWRGVKTAERFLSAYRALDEMMTRDETERNLAREER
jgi:hypothetical protein